MDTVRTSRCQTCFALLIGLIISSASSSDRSTPSSDPCDREDANGCTTLPFTSFPFQTEMTPSCNRHDMCYSCATAFGLSREDCDNSFLRNLVQTCKAVSPASDSNSKSKHPFSFLHRGYLVNRCKHVQQLLQKQNEYDDVDLDCEDYDMTRLRCMEVAGNAFTIVRTVGGFFYAPKPADYCDKDFIPQCLPKQSR